MLPGGAWTLAAATVLLVLVAAKAHGRQVRLLRERAGIMAVDFRKDNGPVVEAIWRRDRLRFWVTAAALGAVAVGGASAGLVLPDLPRAAAIAFAATWAFASGFIFAGLAAWSELRKPQVGDPDWVERAGWASFGWWTLVAVAVALVWLAS